MQITKLAFKLMSKYLVGWEKIAVVDVGSSLPQDVVSLDKDDAYSWALGVVCQYRDAVSALGGAGKTVTVDGKKVVLQSPEDAKKFIIDFIVDNGFTKDGTPYTRSDLVAGGAVIRDALDSIGRSLTRLFRTWDNPPEEVKQFKAWNSENGVGYQEATKVADIASRTKSYIDKVSELIANKVKGDYKLSDTQAKELFESMLFCARYVKRLNSVMETISGRSDEFVGRLAERLVNERHTLNFLRSDKSTSDLESVGVEEARKKDIEKLGLYFDQMLSDAKSFNLANMSPSAFSNKVLKALNMMGYVTKEDSVEEAKQALNSILSKFVMNDNKSIGDTVNELISSKEIRSLNRDVSQEESGYSPVSDYKAQLGLSIDEKLKEMMKGKKDFVSDSDEFKPLSEMRVSEIRVELVKLINKNKKESLSESEKHRMNVLSNAVNLDEQIMDAKKRGDSALVAKLMNEASQIGLVLEEDEGRKRVQDSANRLREVEKTIEESDRKNPHNVIKLNFNKRKLENPTSLDKKDIQMAENNIKAQTMQLKILMPKIKSKLATNQDLDKAANAYALLKFVLNSDNPDDDVKVNYKESLELIKKYEATGVK